MVGTWGNNPHVSSFNPYADRPPTTDVNLEFTQSMGNDGGLTGPGFIPHGWVQRGLVVRCIPFKYINSVENNGDTSERVVEVLMINSTSGPGLHFPKGGWENDETVEEAALREALEEAGVQGDLLHFLGYYKFKSKTLQDESSPEGLCKAAMFALLVKEELESWPEKSTRQRSWLTIPMLLRVAGLHGCQGLLRKVFPSGMLMV